MVFSILQDIANEDSYYPSNETGLDGEYLCDSCIKKF